MQKFVNRKYELIGVLSTTNTFCETSWIEQDCDNSDIGDPTTLLISGDDPFIVEIHSWAAISKEVTFDLLRRSWTSGKRNYAISLGHITLSELLMISETDINVGQSVL